MALTSFSVDGRKGNSVEISRNKPILSHLAVHLLSMLSGRHECLELYLLGTNNFLSLKTTGSIWLSYEAAPPSTTQTPHILCWKSTSNSADLMQHSISILILPLLNRDSAPTQDCISGPWGCCSNVPVPRWALQLSLQCLGSQRFGKRVERRRGEELKCSSKWFGISHCGVLNRPVPLTLSLGSCTQHSPPEPGVDTATGAVS